MNLINNFKYRPEIDGLRALAVLAVLFYHVGLGFPGGYIGVDIFFVISGFLITSLIIKEIEQDKFSFIQFYERRVRRIFPASAVLMLSTVITGWFLLLPSDFIGLGKSIISQSFFSSNIYFWRNTNYFAEAAGLQPLLHMWSLAVEEQFYMIMPFFIWGLMKVLKIGSRIKLILFLGMLFCASLALSIWSLPRMSAFTFYLLPTRAWEMLIGSLVALVPTIGLIKKRSVREALAFIGLLGMILPCFLYTKDTLFPGLAALPPCLGVAFFILASSPLPNGNIPMTAKLFTWRPIIFIGLISYSLYLWHWPLVAFSKYWALEEFTTFYKWGIVALSIILGIASWHFVETPFRKKNIARSRKPLFGYAIIASSILIIGGSSLIAMNGFAGRYSDRVLVYEKSKEDSLLENVMNTPLDLEGARLGEFPIFGNSNLNTVNVLVWGDSHAKSILPAVIEAAGDFYVVGSAWHSSTAPILNYVPPQFAAEFSLGDNSPTWAAAIVEQVEKKQIPNVLLAARWSGYYKTASEQMEENNLSLINFNNNLLKTVKSLSEAGAQVWILREVPNHLVSVPKALIKGEVFDADISEYACTIGQLIDQNETFDALKMELELAGAKILDTSELLLDQTEKKYRMEYKGVALYYDQHHLSINGAKKVKGVFDPIFSQAKAKVNIVNNEGEL
ncbi:peptidoglycan/LPS O-acetylase OafA/YrhL [Gelidibacter algens]|uniref:Peptidoglycan/LPS O-acetylase OafA/YrhL n=1 Tax=Gelidibacter algens TaxID=49280 RepID=A0A1A7R1Y5_9FLAO|nr:acyltransferase family protein [Gelidibacter algens]OBX25518.1 hypothetical protein A9996_09430 [Gelidibacter algens]RAJ22245.1 peptidoglycan/LPS O-acetylase OafA/YrhL [Gelidibacter algens]